MVIVINNEPKIAATNSKLGKLLKELNLLDQKGFAVAVNDKVITRNDWDEFQLKENDRITIIKATQGG
ncbi:MAG: sulfur carrier protein ThiS [Bacteroidota bacterium]